MNKTVLITGACGFAGSYMREYLESLDENLTIIGVDLQNDSNGYDIFYAVDMADNIQINEIIKKNKPDFIIHLAGTFGTANLQDVFKSNVLSAITLFEAVRINCPETTVVIAGSAAEYGAVNSTKAVAEDTICKPVSQYGLSKLMATESAIFYHRVHKLKITIFRPFQIIGKGISDRLAPGAFAKQLKGVIAGGSNVIKVGNLQSSRDFLDIRDVVEGIWSVCKKPASGQIFNICSGKPTQMSDLLDMMITASGVDVKVEVDPAKLRGASDVSMIYGSYQKITSHCGWQPKRSLEESISAIF